MTADRIAIRAMRADDWPAVRRIYEAGIATGDATLEQAAPDWPAWDAAHRAACRFVATDERDRVIGWTALGPLSHRAVYAGVAWESVYVDPSARGRGVGRALLVELVGASEAEGVWTLQAGVLAENAASFALHQRVGFRIVGVQHRLGRDATGRWRDVALLERRSTVVGVDGDVGVDAPVDVDPAIDRD
ncbi:MAG: GNAT family N-acetyltransferase [Candidatus Limnocylindrales bacterium]